MNAADLLIAGLQKRGVEWMATLCGHGLDPLFQAARHAGMRLIDARNEQTAAYIADAYGRLTRKPGVCAVSSGIAQVNALTGVANAWFDRGPMLLISGAAASDTAGMGHFQDLDQAALARPITKISRCVDSAGRVSQILGEALDLAVADPCGPAHLMFPMDVQRAEAGRAPAPASAAPRPHEPDLNMQEVARALGTARSPLLFAGSGIFYDGSGADMLYFCEDCRIPVVTPIWDRGAIDRPSRVFLGVIGAASGGPAILSEADCIVLAGAEIDYRVGYLLPPEVRSDARVLSFRRGWDALAAACYRHDSRIREDWLKECVGLRNEFRRVTRSRAEQQSRAGLHALHLIEAIEGVFNENPVLLIDGGTIGQWAHQLLCSDRYPGDWLTCGRSGVVGWGVGGAMAARLAYPDRPVVLLSGDGAFTFNIADLESAVRQKLPFVALVADDQGWGITRSGHVRQFGEPIASSLGPIAFDKLAESLGARGVRVSTPDEVARELRRAISEPVVTVIHAPIVGGG
ncbi:MAG TPA: thiamine pyrophosphate-binding protein [Bryobacteraceae bacterium]|nr:thiamine pyrophosphate-binding protein [Bryobacteraceae bacterium]